MLCKYKAFKPYNQIDSPSDSIALTSKYESTRGSYSRCGVEELEELSELALAKAVANASAYTGNP